MNNQNCGCDYVFRPNCVILAILGSIIIGIIAAFLTFSATITLTPAFLWVLLGIAVVFLAIIFVTLALSRGPTPRICICRILPVLLTGILGTALTSLILLGGTFAATSVVGAIISGLAILFLSLILSSISCIIRCIACFDEE